MKLRSPVCVVVVVVVFAAVLLPSSQGRAFPTAPNFKNGEVDVISLNPVKESQITDNPFNPEMSPELPDALLLNDDRPDNYFPNEPVPLDYEGNTEPISQPKAENVYNQPDYQVSLDPFFMGQFSDNLLPANKNDGNLLQLNQYPFNLIPSNQYFSNQYLSDRYDTDDYSFNEPVADDSNSDFQEDQFGEFESEVGNRKFETESDPKSEFQLGEENRVRRKRQSTEGFQTAQLVLDTFGKGWNLDWIFCRFGQSRHH